MLAPPTISDDWRLHKSSNVRLLDYEFKDFMTQVYWKEPPEIDSRICCKYWPFFPVV